MSQPATSAFTQNWPCTECKETTSSKRYHFLFFEKNQTFHYKVPPTGVDPLGDDRYYVTDGFIGPESVLLKCNPPLMLSTEQKIIFIFPSRSLCEKCALKNDHIRDHDAFIEPSSYEKYFIAAAKEIRRCEEALKNLPPPPPTIKACIDKDYYGPLKDIREKQLLLIRTIRNDIMCTSLQKIQSFIEKSQVGWVPGGHHVKELKNHFSELANKN
jgi:hypothetical protein